jgi:hypothetical protein
MKRIARYAAVAFVTLIIGIALALLGRGLLSGVRDAPAPPPVSNVEVTPSVPEKLCEVHGVPMFRESVPVLYGYAPHAFPYELRPDYFEAKKQFPHAARWYYAGCVFQSKWFEEVDVCPMCRAAQSVWAATPAPKK